MRLLMMIGMMMVTIQEITIAELKFWRNSAMAEGPPAMTRREMAIQASLTMSAKCERRLNRAPRVDNVIRRLGVEVTLSWNTMKGLGDLMCSSMKSLIFVNSPRNLCSTISFVTSGWIFLFR